MFTQAIASARTAPCRRLRRLGARPWAAAATLAALAAAGCGGAREAAAPAEAPAAVRQHAGEAAVGAAAGDADEEAMAFDEIAVEQESDGATGGDPDARALTQSSDPGEGDAPPAGGARRIIKDAQLQIRVDDVALGIPRLETIAAQSGGYVIETTTDYRDPRVRTAHVRMGVPVDAFEDALERIRQAALEVESESTSGSDVSGEVVDLRAQIANLEATSARVRAFLDQAANVEEALRVNAELTELEGEIAQRKGRLEYLEQRAAFSTISVVLTEPEPAWTPEPTATPWPTATPEPWRPGETVRDALDTTGRLMRALGDLAIWLLIVGLPLVVVGGGVLAGIVWIMRRIGGRRT